MHDRVARNTQQALATLTTFRQAIARRPVLPQPGGGKTLERWRVLAELAARDLGAAKLAEAHWDARSILCELGAQHALLQQPSGHTWAVWAAERAAEPLRVEIKEGRISLSGTKDWCSGADVVDHALLTCRRNEEAWLVQIDMSATGISMDHSRWCGVGMRSVATPRVVFDGTPVAAVIARSGGYLRRPGFWHGGAGIAACWHGGACGVAERLRSALDPGNPFACAHLGAIDAALHSLRAMLQSLAAVIDENSSDPLEARVMALRSHARGVASLVMERLARALGPGPLCSDEAHAQRCADLSVWITQQHAEKDDAALGAKVLEGDGSWQL